MERKATKRKESTGKVREIPDLSPEARENTIIAAAYDEAYRQIKEGTASSQVITHFLKMGSTKERLEKEKLIEENKLLKAKTEELEAEKKSKADYEKVLRVVRAYSGVEPLKEGETL